MAATKRLSEVLQKFPDFKPGWQLYLNGEPVSGDWCAKSPFGEVHTAVVMDSEGKPVFDRPAYREAENTNVIAWGHDREGKVRVAAIRQPRPHSDDPEDVQNERSVVFGQIPMGFLDKVVGKDLLETPEEGAAREVGEESGARVVLSVHRPSYPWQNPNPAFVATWSNLLFVKVDLESIEALKADRNEPIFSAEYITLEELLDRIEAGKDSEGAVYRFCNANSMWLIFIAFLFRHDTLSLAKSLNI